MAGLPKYSVHHGSLILVNSNHPVRAALPDNALAPIGGVDGGILLERHAGTLLSSLMSEIHGWRSIVPVSGWRREAEQQDIWDSALKERGEAFVKKYVALPGCSEHQTGLAIDLGLKQENMDFIRPDFPYTGICQTFRESAARYGFIQRYPAGKEHITGIAHEPWHFRYVGTPHAAMITQMDVTLEEYHAFLKRFPYGHKPLPYEILGQSFEISYLPEDAMGVLPDSGNGFSCMVSGDNMGGFVITMWKG